MPDALDNLTVIISKGLNEKSPQTGQRKDSLHWFRTDAIPCQTVWNTREGREAWKKRQQDSKDRIKRS
jgi:hypothetical protein